MPEELWELAFDKSRADPSMKATNYTDAVRKIVTQYVHNSTIAQGGDNGGSATGT